jgi:replicative DNA helicase
MAKNARKNTIETFQGKLTPQAPDMEMGVLGAMIVDSSCVETAVNLLDADMFYVPEHRAVFEALAELHAENKSIDLLTVTQRLARNNTLEQVGGAYFVSQLAGTVGSGAHIEYHCRIVLQKYLMRKLIEAGTEIQKMAFDDTEDVEDALAKSEKLITSVSDIAIGRQSVKNFTDIVNISLNEAYRRADAVKEGKMTGISTGLRELDTKVLGWEKSNLIILAGRPGQGKTAMMLHFAKTAARANIPVAIFALEMSAVSLSDRLLLSVCDIPAYKFRSGYISRDEFAGLESAAEQLKKLPITIDDTPVVSIQHIRAKARALKRAGKCDMVFIDYLQLIKMDLSQGKNVNNAVSEISREAKILAKEANIPVMLLSQLNREIERRSDKQPQLSDLRDSGAIEQDADVVMFVYRPHFYDPGAEKNAGILTVAKFREGAIGNVQFCHNEGLTQIFDYGLPPIELPTETQTDLPF